jgi:hypothetical protein
MRFFFDRCCPPKLVDVINAYEETHSVRHFRDDNRFKESTPDVEWIKTLSGDNPPWIVISMDAQILKKAHEKKALDQSGLKFFLLGTGWMKMPMHEKVWKLLKTWPNILQEAETSRQRIFEVMSGSSLKDESKR